MLSAIVFPKDEVEGRLLALRLSEELKELLAVGYVATNGKTFGVFQRVPKGWQVCPQFRE